MNPEQGYGENRPPEEQAPSGPGIRERTAKRDPAKQGNEDAFDQVRKEAAQESELTGGMGRTETPRGKDSEGEWHREEDK